MLNKSNSRHSGPLTPNAVGRTKPQMRFQQRRGFEDSKCAKVVTSLVCKIPCVIVCGIVGGDTYLLLFYSRLALQKEIGIILTVLLLLIYLLCISFLLTSYFRCMLTSSAVEDNPPPADFEPDKCPTCNKCGNFKPPRTHHCSLCGTCTLKMDHHCPWVGNCVGLHNYKYFLVFLFWVTISAAVYAILTGASMVTSYKDLGSMVGAWTVLSMFITASFALSVGGFFFFHVHLLRQNKTTLENMKYKRDNTPFQQRSKAKKENFNDVFGENWMFWFMPTVTLRENGYELYNNSAAASLIRNDFNDAKCSEEDDGTDDLETLPHRKATVTMAEEEEEDPKIINQKPIDIGPNIFV
mmetsp:Transcript_6262/g.9930  ORF Transcript_6262/g.9930 Transcript_6262/m.9930 type:complete len:353 (+) Transcript_6262:537-1595(+)